MTEHTVRLIDPTGGAMPRHELTLAPRPGALGGLTFGLLDNGKANSDAFLTELALALGVSGDAMVLFRKGGASHPPEPDVVEAIKRRCDVVVTGVGD